MSMKKITEIEKRIGTYFIKVEYSNMTTDEMIKEIEMVLYCMCKVFFIITRGEKTTYVTYEASSLNSIADAFGEYEI